VQLSVSLVVAVYSKVTGPEMARLGVVAATARALTGPTVATTSAIVVPAARSTL